MCSSDLDRSWATEKLPWKVLFSFAIWNLWITRNKSVFKGSAPKEKLLVAMKNITTEYVYSAGKVKSPRPREEAAYCWVKPEINWYKLNTDGSSIGNQGKACGGELIRDHRGRWISRFARGIGVTSSANAELWALPDGIKRCIDLNIQAMEVELDAKVVVDWAGGSDCPNNAHSSLIADCRYLLNQLP